MSQALAICHRELSRLLGPAAEPLAVLKCAEDHRAFWMPRKVRVVLLAESHVYTTLDELTRQLRPLPGAPAGLPREFVRLVYCLGYGENNLLDRPILAPRNAGTLQFWKVFYSCIRAISGHADFQSLLVSQTSLAERIAQKLRVLVELRACGIWLLDASVAALYIPGASKPHPDTIAAALQCSWDLYVGQRLAEVAPERVVCIGIGVERALGSRLDRLGIPRTAVAQPNARLSSERHLAGFRLYYEACRPPDQVDQASSPAGV